MTNETLVTEILLDHFCGDGETINPPDEIEAEVISSRVLENLALGRAPDSRNYGLTAICIE